MGRLLLVRGGTSRRAALSRPTTSPGTDRAGGRRRDSSWREQALGSKVEDLDIDVMDLSPERVGQFDVVFFLGVLYHLRHPLLALERIASVTRQRLFLETVVDMVGIRRPAMAFYPGRELNNDPTNWWAPNVPALHAMLRDVGFTEVRTVTPQPPAIYRAARARVDDRAAGEEVDRHESEPAVQSVQRVRAQRGAGDWTIDSTGSDTLRPSLPFIPPLIPVHTSPQIDNGEPKGGSAVCPTQSRWDDLSGSI